MLNTSIGFYTVLTQVRDAAVTALVSTPGGKPARVGVVPGAIAWDDCDTCGLLALALVRVFLTDEFPVELSEPASVSATQGALLCADMAVQLVRCAPQPQGTDQSPSVDALDATAQVVGVDAYTIECSTLDTLDKLMRNDSIADFMMKPLVVVGPEGACVGCELSFTVAVIR